MDRGAQSDRIERGSVGGGESGGASRQGSGWHNKMFLKKHWHWENLTAK